MQRSVSKNLQSEVYTYIVLYTYEHRYTPTVENIAKALHYSNASVSYAISSLKEKGKLEGTRGWRVSDLEVVFKNEEVAERLGIKNARCRNK